MSEAKMQLASRGIVTVSPCAAASTLRAGGAALLVGLVVGVSACGGGNDGVAPGSTPATASAPALNPAPLVPPPVAGTPVSVDTGASGDPVSLRVARSANGDSFAVWLAYDGTRHNLWANRYRGTAAAWGNAVNIETSAADIDHFDFTVDAGGNSVVVWNEPTPGGGSGTVMSVRFATGAGVWAAPVQLSFQQGLPRPRVASDATGAVLAVYGDGIVGRFFDPVSGTWQPETGIGKNTFGTGHSFGPVPLLDGSGNALVVYHDARVSAAILASNYYSSSTGSWGELPPDVIDILGWIPDSFVFGFNENIQLAAAGGGNFLAAWQASDDTTPTPFSVIKIARFTSSTRTWSKAETLLTGSFDKADFKLQRLASDAAGNAQLIWTEREGTRTALMAMRIDGAVCSAPEVLDRAIGGGAARADLGVDAAGDAIAIWQQFEGGRPDDGSRSNIAINRFDAVAQLWSGAVVAETQSGNAISPSASASGGQALLGWIQSENGVNRVKALLQPLGNAPGP
jgi:hypothetical protein